MSTHIHNEYVSYFMLLLYVSVCVFLCHLNEQFIRRLVFLAVTTKNCIQTDFAIIQTDSNV